MKAIDFKEVNVRIAENQPEYETLPVKLDFNDQSHPATMCFELDQYEMEQVFRTGRIWLTVLTFGQNFQPIYISCLKPENVTEPELNATESDFPIVIDDPIKPDGSCSESQDGYVSFIKNRIRNKVEILSAYFPYNVKFSDSEILNDSETFELTSLAVHKNTIYSNGVNITNEKPLLRPLSQLNEEIEHNGETFVPIDFFEIGECDDHFFDFDHGNIGLIRLLKSISKNNYYNDINYLPYPVVQKLISWHFDVFGLIEEKEAIDITTLKNDPYAS